MLVTAVPRQSPGRKPEAGCPVLLFSSPHRTCTQPAAIFPAHQQSHCRQSWKERPETRRCRGPLPKPQVCSCRMTEQITEGPSCLKGMSLLTCFLGKNKRTYEMYTTKSLPAVYDQLGVYCLVCMFVENLNVETSK